LSSFLPAFNEEKSILPLADELAAALPSLAPWVVECVFVGDGSMDGNRRLMLEARGRHLELRVRVVALEGNHGLTAAMDARFRAARGELVATPDTDRLQPQGVRSRWFHRIKLFAGLHGFLPTLLRMEG
jgi:glycosyltransferase involved in cell wall biosynthesis